MALLGHHADFGVALKFMNKCNRHPNLTYHVLEELVREAGSRAGRTSVV